MKVVNECINVDFLNQMFETYEKPYDYASRSLKIIKNDQGAYV